MRSGISPRTPPFVSENFSSCESLVLIQSRSKFRESKSEHLTPLITMDQLSESSNVDPRVWVFGYGSLCWHPGFEYKDSVTGYIKGYSRKFWQGNTTHRGTLEKPGRVATLVNEKEGIVWGRAFQLGGELALSYLNNRECVLGGYSTLEVDFYPKYFTEVSASTEPIKALVYIATPTNDMWLGEATLNDIADQIIGCKGTSGYNVEYVLRLAQFMHKHIPEAKDSHLFDLEFLIRNKIEELDLCLSEIMGTKQSNPSLCQPDSSRLREDGASASAAVDYTSYQTSSHQYSSRVPSKNLRCVDI